MNRYRRKRWAAQVAALLALWSGVGLPRAQAQGPGTTSAKEQADGKIYTPRRDFKLPIQIDERARSSLREVSLYVKSPNGPWARAQTAAPTQSHFLYRVERDGEYWFSVVTVDRTGKAVPADVTIEPPGLKVVVDTQPPLFQLQPAPLPGGQMGLRCVLEDADPDPQRVKISYNTADQHVRFLEPVPGQPGVFSVPSPDVLAGSVRVSVADRAGNQSTRDVNLRDVVVQAPSPLPQPIQNAGAANPLPSNPPPAPSQGDHSGVVQAGGPAPSGPTVLASYETQKRAETAAPSSSPPMPLPSESQKSATALVPDSKGGGPARQLINTKHASIDYRVDPVGPSGVGRVEVWVTADKGASWQRLGEDVDRHSPAEIDLPGEGLYGIRLAVMNGNGFGGAPPAPGDAPSTWVEVDTTAPVAQLRDVDPMTNDGKLQLRWVCSDKNLSAEPISLYYATRREGPWQPIARNVKNDGSYHWAFPHDAGGQFFVRLEVSDLAGNFTRCESPMPVVLDMTEPRALVVGVSGASSTTSHAH